MSITFSHITLVSSLIFSLGAFTVLTRRNIVAILLGIELILNAAAINVVGYSLLHGAPVEGQIVALFIVMLAACDAAVAFGILVNFYRNIRTVNVESAQRMSQ